jgi:hypothetical protein
VRRKLKVRNEVKYPTPSIYAPNGSCRQVEGARVRDLTTAPYSRVPGVRNVQFSVLFRTLAY